MLALSTLGKKKKVHVSNAIITRGAGKQQSGDKNGENHRDKKITVKEEETLTRTPVKGNYHTRARNIPFGESCYQHRSQRSNTCTRIEH